MKPLSMRKVLHLVVLAACGGSGTTLPDSGTDGSVDGLGCVREPALADRVRHVVIAHPLAAGGVPGNDWEVLDLSMTGELSRPGRRFTMGHALTGEVAFTADGKIGVAAQGDGSVGVFAL